MKICVGQVGLVELGFEFIAHRLEYQSIAYRLRFSDLFQVVIQLVVLGEIDVFVIAQRHFEFLSDGFLAVANLYVWPFANVSTAPADAAQGSSFRFGNWMGGAI